MCLSFLRKKKQNLAASHPVPLLSLKFSHTLQIVFPTPLRALVLDRMFPTPLRALVLDRTSSSFFLKHNSESLGQTAKRSCSNKKRWIWKLYWSALYRKLSTICLKDRDRDARSRCGHKIDEVFNLIPFEQPSLHEMNWTVQTQNSRKLLCVTVLQSNYAWPGGWQTTRKLWPYTWFTESKPDPQPRKWRRRLSSNYAQWCQR